MAKLVIVHPGSGTVIDLDDEVYIVDYDLAERHVSRVSLGEYVDDEVEGWIVDNAAIGTRLSRELLERL